MKLRARQITSFLLLLVWTFPLLSILIINIEEKLAHYRMMEKMEQSHLQEIVVAADEVTWMDDNEIWLNGHMFDIQHSTLKNGVYTFRGLFDDEETRLVLQLDESTSKNKDESKSLGQIFEWVHLPYPTGETHAAVFTDIRRMFMPLQEPFFKELLRTIITPPPDFFHAPSIASYGASVP